MTRRKWLLGGIAVAVIAAALGMRSFWNVEKAVAQAPAQRTVPVMIAKAEKKTLPVRLEALGSVTTIASVAIKSRLETEIVGVHFADGALVKQGDLLFTLDSRSIEADVKRAQATLASARSQVEQNERDVARYTELVSKNASSIVTLQNAKTQSDVSRALVDSTSAQLESLKVQLSFCSIRAPITGRISQANVKVGNFVRPADVAPLATINQMAPIYVSFTVPQRALPELRQALAAETASVQAFVPGDTQPADGKVTMIENQIDIATGMATVRATMPNAQEQLWPGTLVNARMTLREQEGITVPSPAVQVSQSGSYVFVVKDGVAQVRNVKVDRADGQNTVIESGLEAGETVVTEGQLTLTNGTRVTPRQPAAGT